MSLSIKCGKMYANGIAIGTYETTSKICHFTPAENECVMSILVRFHFNSKCASAGVFR